MSPKELIRKGEAIYKELFKNAQLTDKEWVDAMINYPKLIERPIVILGQKAVVARPTEKISEIL
jgi:arsenate reductase